MSSPDSDSTPPSPSAANSSSPPLDGQERQSAGSDRDSQRQKDASSSQKVPRRRVKTGCLTCRKRRIKCGEEKPTCKNCIKSKRVCEGYIPGMVFRRSVADVTTTTYPGVTTPYYPPYAQASNAYVHDSDTVLNSDRHASLTTIRPKPPGDEGILYDPIAQHAAIPAYSRTPQGWVQFPPSTAAYPDMRMANAIDGVPQTDYGASWMSSSDSSYLLGEQARGIPVVASSAGPTAMGHPTGPPVQTPHVPRTADPRFYHDRSQRRAQPPGVPRVATSEDHSTWSAQYQPYSVYDYGQTPQQEHDTMYPQDRSTRHNISFQRAPPGSYPPYDGLSSLPPIHRELSR